MISPPVRAIYSDHPVHHHDATANFGGKGPHGNFRTETTCQGKFTRHGPPFSPPKSMAFKLTFGESGGRVRPKDAEGRDATRQRRKAHPSPFRYFCIEW